MADKRMITDIDDVRMLKHSFVFIEIILDGFHSFSTPPSPSPPSHLLLVSLLELCLLYLKLKRVLAGRQVRICCSKQIKEIQKELLTFDYF